ncbi:subunit of heteropentameric Replication factor C (RF-C) [Pycnococcus provasolii]|uniref:Subunit of heteropentameric Replication factor C (RF-C) n=1 Tax=Pycnococcus provasolii TaxID=41880 RepID=A0A830H3K0_9CHLO|nr:subunit of heteropentameric Replication factor C (RF-C) [Pycnococcus provasolii]
MAEATLPWLEKYRPTLIDDIVGNEEAVARLHAMAAEGSMPNLIFAGPPGTGKTTSVMCLARALLGGDAELMKEAVLELNASDERGIDVVRNKVKIFAQKKVTLPPGRHKVIILDEADSMTGASQQALRRTMEIYSATTRFALACNQSTKIIEPIQSRCAIVRFTKLSDEEVVERLLHVCRCEKVAYVDDGLEAVVFTSDGDMRQALNNLQATHSGFGLINAQNVFKVCDQPHPAHVNAMLTAALEGKVDDAYALLASLFETGYSATDVITTLFRIAKSYEAPEFVKLEMIKEIGTCHMRIVEGLGTLLQMSGLLGRISMIKEKDSCL